MDKVIIQGYPGSFHDEACHTYFQQELEVIPADTFNQLGIRFAADNDISYGVMAIENSIAGTILQNYRILRERKFRIIGEVYLRIELNLMGVQDQCFDDIQEVHSHPMALNQCLRFLNQFEHIKLIESEDTALTAKQICKSQVKHIAALASKRAADIYKLKIHSPGIEDNKTNYTRFFIIQKKTETIDNPDKASIYCRVSHEKGSLLAVLKEIKDFDMNLSKLQSYPVLGRFNEYFFHLDIEFKDYKNYLLLKENLKKITLETEELGVYRRAHIYDAIEQ